MYTFSTIYQIKIPSETENFLPLTIIKKHIILDKGESEIYSTSTRESKRVCAH